MEQELKEEIYNEVERLSPDERYSPVELKEFFSRDKKHSSIILEEQKQVGKEIDSAYQRELLLRQNKEQFHISDYSKILYRLPIKNDVLENIYTSLIKDGSKK